MLSGLLVLHWLLAPVGAHGQECGPLDLEAMRVNPTATELKCHFGVTGPGRFGLLSYVDVPVYQPATPMPGTHLIRVPGHARPTFMETFERWEWRVHRTRYGPDARVVHRSLDLLAPALAERITALEQRMRDENISFVRRETWRSFARQAYLFQQGRSRPGPLATTTLTSWHSAMSVDGRPAGRAVDYDIAARNLERFHQLAAEAGLHSFGHESHDPGHVFLPNLEDIPAIDIAVLRTLPRVPEVTLATGLPSDRNLPPGGRDAVRRTLAEFVENPFIPMPIARVTRPILTNALLRDSWPADLSLVQADVIEGGDGHSAEGR